MSVQPSLTTTRAPRGDTIRHSKREALPIQAQWGHSLQMDMACTIWLGTCGSGVGIGMKITAVHQRLTPRVLLPDRIVYFEVEVGIATGLAVVEHHIAATTSRVTRAITEDFAQPGVLPNDQKWRRGFENDGFPIRN